LSISGNLALRAPVKGADFSLRAGLAGLSTGLGLAAVFGFLATMVRSLSTLSGSAATTS
jgi:hypothetical protein